MGTITIPTANNIATISGTVTNCVNTAVANGYIIVMEGNYFTRYPLNNYGAYNFSEFFCTFPQAITLIGEDVANTQQSANVSYVVTSAGINTVGNIQACNTTTQQYVNYTINAIPYSFTSPADVFNYSNNVRLDLYSSSQTLPTSGAIINMSNAGLAIGSTQDLLGFVPTQVADTFRILTPIPVHITEYGAVGQFTTGNFTGVFTGAAPANTQYNVTCNFRLRRNN